MARALERQQRVLRNEGPYWYGRGIGLGSHRHWHGSQRSHINVAEQLLHDEEADVYADAGYQGIEKRCENSPVRWHVAMRPAKRRKLGLSDRVDAIFDQTERLKTGVRAKVEHPFRILKQQFGYTKTRYRGLKKNTAQITTLFALGNLWMARKAL